MDIKFFETLMIFFVSAFMGKVTNIEEISASPESFNYDNVYTIEVEEIFRLVSSL